MIKYSDLSKGCGLFSANDASDGILNFDFLFIHINICSCGSI